MRALAPTVASGPRLDAEAAIPQLRYLQPCLGQEAGSQRRRQAIPYFNAGRHAA